MNIFITNGTFEYLQAINEKYLHENLILMESDNGALLLHETKSNTIFNEPRRFKVINSIGRLNNEEGFFVFDHIPTTDDSKPIVEHHFKKYQPSKKHFNSFLALRILSPVNSNTFIILTMWADEQEYRRWQKITGFKRIHEQITSTVNFNYSGEVFLSPSYVSTYKIRQDDDEDNNDSKDKS